MVTEKVVWKQHHHDHHRAPVGVCVSRARAQNANVCSASIQTSMFKCISATWNCFFVYTSFPSRTRWAMFDWVCESAHTIFSHRYQLTWLLATANVTGQQARLHCRYARDNCMHAVTPMIWFYAYAQLFCNLWTYRMNATHSLADSWEARERDCYGWRCWKMSFWCLLVLIGFSMNAFSRWIRAVHFQFWPIVRAPCSYHQGSQFKVMQVLISSQANGMHIAQQPRLHRLTQTHVKAVITNRRCIIWCLFDFCRNRAGPDFENHSIAFVLHCYVADGRLIFIPRL